MEDKVINSQGVGKLLRGKSDNVQLAMQVRDVLICVSVYQQGTATSRAYVEKLVWQRNMLV
jgi:hypothetical protein